MRKIILNFKRSNLLLFSLLIMILQVSRVNAQVNFNGALQSNDISVCDDSSQPLEVDFTVEQATNNAIKVSVALANGIEYDGGFAIVSSSPAGVSYTITEDDITNPANPKFEIKHTDGSPIQLAEGVVFKFERKAVCTAYNNALTANDTGFEFKDQVSITIDGTTKSKESFAYNVLYPNFVLTPPNEINNANIGDDIIRTYTLKNGGLTSSNKVFLTIDYGDAKYFQAPGSATLEVDAGNGFIALTPVNTTNGKVTYVLEDDALGTDNLLVNGEIITLREQFKLKTCNPITHYTAGWGCDASAPCQQTEKESVITMAAGAPNFDKVTFERVDYVNLCTSYKMKFKYTNTGTGGAMGTMYDVGLIFKGGNGPNAIGFTKHFFSDCKIGGNAIANSFTNPTYHAVDVKTGGVFNFDPDGAGEGLEDLDNDGFYDDLAPGATVELEVTVTVDNTPMECAEPLHEAYNYGKISFHTACDDQEQVYETNKVYAIYYSRTQLADASYTPANIEDGVPFSGRVGASYFGYGNNYSNDKTRFVTEITVPTGMTLSNIKWVDGRFPSTATPVAPQSITQNGNTYTIVSATKYFGHVTFDATYDCQADNSNVAISYKVHEVSNYEDYQNCYSLGENIICGSRSFNVVGCSPCPGGGASTGIPVVERSDNSLGWTDATMTTLQDRNNISAYDLAKSMYKDEFKVETTTAKQYGAATNLGARLVVATDTKKQNGLEVLTANVKITRAGTVVATGTDLTTFTTQYSTTDEQIIDWDFTSILPADGLLDGDKISITTHYRVNSQKYPMVDQNAGRNWYIYNSDSPVGTPVWEGTHKYCTNLTPEIYLMGSRTINASNTWFLQACDATNLGGNLAYIARRFDVGALQYQSEYRPSLNLKKAYIEVPKSLTINLVQYRRLDPLVDYQTLTAESVTDMGDYNLFVYTIPEGIGHSNFTYRNTYDAHLKVNLSANCMTSTDFSEAPRIKSYFDYEDYYYYSSKQNPIPSDLNISKELESSQPVNYSKKPGIELVNQTGVVNLTGKTGNWVLRYNNVSQASAPYTWLALPDVAGLTITAVTRVSDGTLMTPMAYTGGKMYQLGDAGVASGGSEDYKIEFEYTDCTPVILTAQGGWNCSDYPATPDQYICDAKEVELEARPLNTLIEFSETTVPTTNPKPDLCTELNYEYRIQASDAANLYDLIFQIVPVEGLSLANNNVEVQYPAGSGSWETITLSGLQNGVYNINVLEHTALATLGYLPGTEEAGSNNDNRQANVRFTLTTDCDFVSGKNFNVKTEAKNSCGQLVQGSLVPFSVPAIEIEGAETPYLTITELVWVDDAPGGADCKAAKEMKVKEIISAADGVVTGATGKIEILIPKGFKYNENSYNAITPAAPDASTLLTEILPTGEQRLTLDIPAGLTTGTIMEYTLGIKEDNSGDAVCGEVNIQVSALDVITGLTCGSTVCPNSEAITGVSNLSFTLEKANITISTISANSIYGNSGENITVEYKVENSADIALATGTTITLFDDKDDNGVFSTNDVIVATQTTTADVTTATPFTGTFTATDVDPANLCHLKISILPADGCFCSIIPANVNISDSPALAGDDIEVCAGDTEQIGVASTGYTSYAWSSTEAEATTYLSATDIAQPNFTYTGASLETAKTLTYTLTVTRPGNCTFTDEINVTVESHDVCFVKAYNDINQTPEGFPVSGDVSTNDDNIADTNPIVSAQYYDAAGNPQNLPLGTPTTVYGDDGSEAGTMTLNVDGTYTFEPKDGYTGDVPFTYVAQNANGRTDSATLDIKVIPVPDENNNNDPIAQDDTYTVEQGETANLNIISSNDSDPDGDNLTVTSVELQGNYTTTSGGSGTTIPVGTPTDVYDGTTKVGVLTVNSDGSTTFVSEADFTGDVPFKYTISDGNGGTDTAITTITVLPKDPNNNVYANDDANTGNKGETLTGNILTNDDIEGSLGTLTVNGTSVSGNDTEIDIPGKGKLIMNPNGEYTFIPNPDFVGTAVIPYTVCNTDGECDTATLNLTILDEVVKAKDDVTQTPQDVPVSGNVLTNDDGTGLTVTGATVGGVNITPGVETDVEGGKITLNSDGTYTFKPNTGWTGTVPTITYTVKDKYGNETTATLDITVIPEVVEGENEAPIANNDVRVTEQDTPVSLNVLDNDHDSDKDEITVTQIKLDTNGDGNLETVVVPESGSITKDVYKNGTKVGTITINSAGETTFTPESGFVGQVPDIEYTLQEGSADQETDTALIKITVMPNNGNSVYANDDYGVARNAAEDITLNALDNDLDPEGDQKKIVSVQLYNSSGVLDTVPLTSAISNRPVYDENGTKIGTISIDEDGNLTFDGNTNFQGTLAIPYAIEDGKGAGDKATIYLTQLRKDEEELPIELVSFDARLQGNSVELTWVSATEINNDFYSIYKSNDGEIWEFWKDVQGAGNSNVELSYTEMDNEPYQGKNYYKLSQTDFDGTTEELGVRVVQINAGSNFTAYPNPTEGLITIDGAYNDLNSLRIVSTLGAVVTNDVRVISVSALQLKLDFSNLSNGTYFIHLDNAIIQIVKQ